MATGRTVSRWIKFQIKDSGGVLRDINVTGLSVVGLKYEEVDTTAFQDAVKSALPNQPDAPVEIDFLFDNSAAQAASGTGAAAALSGTHTVLSAINGLTTPLTLGVYFGIRGYWATGDPVFGIASSAVNGYLCVEYTVNPDLTGHAKFVLSPGSAAPAWGTAALA
jgi:hypothetical protein